MKPPTPESLVELPEGLPPRLREYIEPFQTHAGRSRLNWIVGGLAFLSFLAFLAAGADTPANPSFGAPTTTTTLPSPKLSRIPGFNEVHIGVGPFPGLPGPLRHFCGVLADTPPQQAKGLMGRTDLAGYDGMVFLFPADTNQAFYMKNTKIPLTVGFFDSTGRLIGETDMKPCPVRIRNCPQYGPPGGANYRFAIETQQGGLKRLGVGPASTVTPAGGCI